MAFDEQLAARIRVILREEAALSEKKMFGGIAFLLGGKMCCGVIGNKMVARIGPEQAEAALRMPHVKPMDFTGRPLKGYVYLSPDGIKTKVVLSKWIARALAFTATLPGKKSRLRARS